MGRGTFARAAALLTAGVAVLTACGQPAYVEAGRYAADPICGEVLQALPQEINGAKRRSITSQATAAWGEPPVSLRCGIEPPAPTTDRCITVKSFGDDPGIDWISVETTDPTFPEAARVETGAWVFRTYGRVPAIEVVVPTEWAGDQPTAVLLDLAPAVEVSPVQRECVGVTDVY